MVKMRLFRMGDKKNPIYRVVVADSRKAATGEYIDCIGHYNPGTVPAQVTITLSLLRNGSQRAHSLPKRYAPFLSTLALWKSPRSSALPRRKAKSPTSNVLNAV